MNPMRKPVFILNDASMHYKHALKKNELNLIHSGLSPGEGHWYSDLHEIVRILAQWPFTTVGNKVSSLRYWQVN